MRLTGLTALTGLTGPVERIPSVARGRGAWRKINSVSTTAATVAPARHVRGRIRVPGDKSISHRYALIAALAHGTSRLGNYAPGADCRSTLACLHGLGVPVMPVMEVMDVMDEDTTSITIMGRGIGGLGSPTR